MTLDAIRQCVQRIRKNRETLSVQELCEAEGILVQYFPMGDGPGACKGFFIRKFGVSCITINSDLSARNQEVILAHEFGHACLHEHLAEVSDFLDVFRNGESSICEREANQFAAELLLSDDAVSELLMDGYSLKEAAQTLGVPVELLMVKIRMMRKDAGLISVPSNFMKDVVG